MLLRVDFYLLSLGRDSISCGLELVKVLMNLTWSWTSDILLAITQAFVGPKTYLFGSNVCPRFYVFIAVQGAGLLLSNNFSQIVKAVSHDPHASSAGDRPGAIRCDGMWCPWWAKLSDSYLVTFGMLGFVVGMIGFEWAYLRTGQHRCQSHRVESTSILGPNPWFCRGQEWVDGDAWVVFNDSFAHPFLIVVHPHG